MLMLMLTIIVPATSLASLTRIQLGHTLFNPRNRDMTSMCLKLSDLRTKVVTAVVGSILLISSPTPSFAESAGSKDMVPITSLNKVNQPVMLKQKSESVLSDRVDKIENDIIEMKGISKR